MFIIANRMQKSVADKTIFRTKLIPLKNTILHDVEDFSTMKLFISIQPNRFDLCLKFINLNPMKVTINIVNTVKRCSYLLNLTSRGNSSNLSSILKKPGKLLKKHFCLSIDCALLNFYDKLLCHIY